MLSNQTLSENSLYGVRAAFEAAQKKANATVATAECGKPLAEARAEVAYAASFVEWFAEEAPRVAGEVKSNVAQDRRLLTVRQPVGVAAAITPWNSPIASDAQKLAPALAAGCAVAQQQQCKVGCENQTLSTEWRGSCGGGRGHGWTV